MSGVEPVPSECAPGLIGECTEVLARHPERTTR